MTASKREAVGRLIEMLDGRVFWSDDGWATIWARSRDGKRWKKVPAGPASDLVRFLAIAQAGPGS
jgi:hypothetical protein